MAQYITGIATKERILNTCKSLFYDRGYKNTKSNDICEHAQVHPGSIKHHFKGKKNIAAQIYNEMMTYYCNRIPELFVNEDELTALILQHTVHQRLFFDDTSYRRFSIEFESEYFSISEKYDYKYYFSNIYSFAIKRMDAKKADFYFAAYSGMDKGIEPYIDMNIDSLTFEEAVIYTNEIYYSFLPKDELDKSVQRALELMKTFRIKNEGFNISIS